MPAHIDVTKIPTGIYWDKSGSGRWFIFNKTGDSTSRKTIAWKDATLSELHTIAEQISCIDRRSLRWLLEQFNHSKKFSDLAQETKKHYRKIFTAISKIETKNGLFIELDYARMTSALFQKLVDKISESTPTKANHILRYVRRVFSWGINRGLCMSNPAKGVEQAREKKQHGMPDKDVYETILAYAKVHNKFVWAAMELAYLCRLRRVEVITMSDANISKDGIVTNRRKGSRNNVVELTPRLENVLRVIMDARVSRIKKNKSPVHIDSKNRFLFVNNNGARLTASALASAFRRIINKAIAEGLITKDQAFSLHGLKHLGVTNTKGNRAQKQEASGHVNPSMLNVYDHSLPLVKPSEE